MLTDVVQSSAVVGGAGWNPTTECSNNILIPYIYKCTFKDQRGLCVYSRRNEWDLYSAVAQGLLGLSAISIDRVVKGHSLITVWYGLFNSISFSNDSIPVSFDIKTNLQAMHWKDQREKR